jgi:hypothetical protein
MPTLLIKRQRDTTGDPKHVLRAHIDQLPLHKQRQFVATALQLIAERTSAERQDQKRRPCQPNRSM